MPDKLQVIAALPVAKVGTSNSNANQHPILNLKISYLVHTIIWWNWEKTGSVCVSIDDFVRVCGVRFWHGTLPPKTAEWWLSTAYANGKHHKQHEDTPFVFQLLHIQMRISSLMQCDALGRQEVPSLVHVVADHWFQVQIQCQKSFCKSVNPFALSHTAFLMSNLLMFDSRKLCGLTRLRIWQMLHAEYASHMSSTLS